MLILLWGILLQSPQSGFGKAMFAVHLGLFILWQPFVPDRERLSRRALLIVLAGLTSLFILFDFTALVLWTLLLASVVGGKVFLEGDARARIHHFGAFVFLVLLLLFMLVPAAFPPAQMPALVGDAVSVVLAMLIAVLLILPKVGDSVPATEVTDFVNSVFVLLLLAVLVSASLASMLLFGKDYAGALFATLLVIGAILLVLGWAWNPHGGYSGMREGISRYLMSLAMPAEQWLQTLAEHATHDDEPDRFVAGALAELSANLGWLRGLRWTTGAGEGEIGQPDGVPTRFKHRELEVSVFSRHPLSPALSWHFRLLVQVLGEFHADKLRAQRLKELSYMQAVHETGARLTHDIKNQLQSLQTLCHLAEEEGSGDSPEFRALLRRQLPVLAERVSATLGKLRASDAAPEPVTLQPAADWWNDARRRHAHDAWVRFAVPDYDDPGPLPAEVFTAALENLLANATDKRARQPDLHVEVSLRIQAGSIAFEVSDDGEAIPDGLAVKLLNQPVRSDNGFGIGLYQAARLAATHDFRLSLAENRPGCVRFRLEGPGGRPPPA